jgi:hypothetical protein
MLPAPTTEHVEFPKDGWFYIKSGLADLVLDVEHGAFVNHMKPGAYIQLRHQKLKTDSRSHALLELQLWRYVGGYLLNRRTGLALTVESSK